MKNDRSRVLGTSTMMVLMLYISMDSSPLICLNLIFFVLFAVHLNACYSLNVIVLYCIVKFVIYYRI